MRSTAPSLVLLASLAVALAQPVMAQQAPEKADEQLAKLLVERKVTLNFEKATLGELADCMCDLLGINVVVARGSADARVTVRLRDVTAKAALEAAARSAGLELSITGGVAYLHPAGQGLGPLPALTPELRRLILTFNFDETPVGEALLFLQDVTNGNIVMTAAVEETRTVTLRVRELPMELALALFARQAGLTVRQTDGVLVFDQAR